MPKGPHHDKWKRCVQHVKAKGSAANPYAVCTKSVGSGKVKKKDHKKKKNK